ncbi:hypothetical protein F4Z98_05885 [Candidatus Poribacteria bacterium]|nr:hypothetical protein [Candidatus Poribacteria bacterium]MYB01791.1 hypothetical protein [Candidatus Poribacteria bacterium]
MNATIDIYGFNIFNEGVKVEDTLPLSLTCADMDTAKRAAHQRAVELGLKAESAWQESCKTYSSRQYRTIAGARRLVVVERC